MAGRSCLPDDLIKVILVELPAISLLRCKSVSKSWYSFINDPHFIKLHLQKSCADIRCQKILLRTFGEFQVPMYSSAVKFQSAEASLCVDSKINSLEPPFPGSLDNVQLLFFHVRASNGLVFIYYHRGMIIWNPTIRRYKIIPLPVLLHGRGWKYDIVGFGYDCVADDYKVLYVQVINESQQRHDVQIFSANNQTWKKIDDIPVPVSFSLIHQDPVSLNGTINFIATSSANGYPEYVGLSFSLKDEKFVVSPVLINNWYSVRFHVLSNRVCISGFVGREISIMSLEKDGETGLLTWASLMNVPTLSSLNGDFDCDGLHIIRVKENGNILWRNIHKDGYPFVEYNVLKDELTEYILDDIPLGAGLSLLHVESLVSLQIPWD